MEATLSPSIDDFIFHETASFYKFKEELSNNKKDLLIKRLFKAIVDKGIEGEKYVDIRRNIYENVAYSFLAYKRLVKPTCFNDDYQPDTKWLERKFAFLFIIEYENYVVVTKRNIPSIKILRESLDVIDYETIRSALVTDKAKFQRFGMTNTDVSDSAMRSKTVEADNLKDVFPAVGANTFKLNSYRMALPHFGGEEDELVSVTMNLSKINQIGIRNKWKSFIDWSKRVVDAIKVYRQGNNNSFLSIFAQPVNYFTEYSSGNLIPNAILLQMESLINDERIIGVSHKKNVDGVVDHTEVIDKSTLYAKYHAAFGITADEEGHYMAKSDDEVLALVDIAENGISLHSNEMENLWLIIKKDTETSDEEDEDTLLGYIERNGLYVIHFENPSLKYSGGVLYKDATLWGRLDEFLDVFEDDEDLCNTKTEKGNFTEGQTSFDRDSLFSFCEQKYSEDGKIMVCDDLGTEWGDYILIGKNSVSYYAAKHKGLCFSASAFQEVVGQAQKNLGVFFPLDSMLDSKRYKWSMNYIQSGVHTSIPRVRTVGRTAEDAVSMWKKALNSANYRRDVFLVIDFISKKRLADCLQKLKGGENLPEKKEAIPILWLLSAFISACQNMNIGVHITCQP